MANVFNKTDCFIDASNTGIADCVTKPGKYLFDIAIPKGTRFTNTEAEAMQATLTALFLEDIPYQRGSYIGPWVNIDTNGGEPIKEDFDGGAYTTLGDGAETITRRLVEGALCGHNTLRQFNGKQDRYEWLRVFASTDQQYQYHIMGTKKYNVTTGVLEMGGIKYNDLWSPSWKVASGNTTAGFFFTSNMTDVKQINENRIIVSVAWDVSELPRVNDVIVTAAKSSTGVFDVQAINSCSGLSLTDLFPALAAAGAWTVLNDLGNAVTASTVTIVNGKFRFALDTSDADYIAGASFTFALKAISVTSAAPYNVEYIEGNTTAAVAK